MEYRTRACHSSVTVRWTGMYVRRTGRRTWGGGVEGVTGDVMWGHVWERKYVLQVDNPLSCCGHVHMYTYVHVCTYVSAILFGVQQTRLEYCLSVLPCAYYHKWQWYQCNHAFCHCHWKTVYNCLHFGPCAVQGTVVVHAAYVHAYCIVQNVLGCPQMKRTLKQCPDVMIRGWCSCRSSILDWW